MTPTNVTAFSLLTDFDIHLIAAGRHYKLYEKLGSKPMQHEGVDGTYFAVWAPNADSVSVIGSFNQWNRTTHVLNSRWDSSGIWEGFIPGVKEGDIYKYNIKMRGTAAYLEKGDPFAELWETPPKTASVVKKFNYKWKDAKWMKGRHKINSLEAPVSVYEMHIGSWKRKFEEQNRSLTGMGVHPRVQGADIGKSLPFITRHSAENGPFAMYHFVVRERQHKVFAKSVHQAEGEFILVKPSINRVFLHVDEHVIHPAHHPFHSKSKAANAYWPRHHGPGCTLLCDGLHIGEFLVNGFVHFPEE